MTGAAHLPEFGLVASKLAALAPQLPGDNNPFRHGLQRLSAHLAPATRNLAAAQRELGLLLLHLTGRGQVFDQPETWISCACAVLLAHEQMRLTALPSAPARPS